MQDQSNEPPGSSSEPHDQAGFDTERGAQAREASGTTPGGAGAQEGRPTSGRSPQGASEPPPNSMQSAFGPPEGQYPASSEPPTKTTHTARRIPKWAIGALAIGVAAGVLFIGVSIGHDTTSTATSAQTSTTTVQPATTSSSAASGQAKDQQFLSQLDSYSIPHSDPSGSIKEALVSCFAFERGKDLSEVAYAVVSDEGLNLGQAAQFLGVAVAAYCPKYVHLFDN